MTAKPATSTTASPTCTCVTDLNVTGKAAQFGGGVMKDVSNRMLAQFADNLAQLIQSGAASGATRARCGCPPRRRPAREPAPVQPTFTPAGDEGLDAMGLLLGSDLVKSAVRPVLFGLTGLLVGYLYGKNRTLERMVRRASDQIATDQPRNG